MQYELQGREGMRALEMNRTPALRAGMAPIATSARVAATIAGLPPVPPDAADVMMGAAKAKAAAYAAQAAPLTPVEEPIEEVPKAKSGQGLVMEQVATKGKGKSQISVTLQKSDRKSVSFSYAFTIDHPESLACFWPPFYCFWNLDRPNVSGFRRGGWLL